MVAITLPDGSVREFDGPVTGLEIAQSIGPGLAKDALAVKVDGALWDLSRPLHQKQTLRRLGRNFLLGTFQALGLSPDQPPVRRVRPLPPDIIN